VFGVPIRIHPVTIIMTAAAFWLGEGERLMIMTGSILFHEMMHVAVARIMRVRVVELEATPMGGAARLENLWKLRPGQMTAVALAGPAANLFLMVCAAALCWWHVLPPYWTAAVIEQNTIIFLFNMLPALPLDGGRVLCGLMQRRFSAVCSVRLGIGMGYALAGLMAALSAYGLTQGRLNITLPVAGVYLALSARRERRQAENSWLESLTGRMGELEEEEALPVCWLAVSRSTKVREAAIRMRPRHVHMIAVFDEQMRLVKVIGERELTEALMVNSDQKMDEMEENDNSKKLKKRC